MEANHTTAIARLVSHHGGPTALSRKMEGDPPYQRIQQWVARGWVAPGYIFRLEGFLPEGMTLRDLHEDREAVKAGA